MTDANLDAKFHALADPVLGAAQVAQLIDACWKLGDTANVGTIAALARP